MNRVGVVMTLVALCAARAVPASAQVTLDPAIKLYEAAAYEDALAALDAVPVAAANLSDRVAVDHYRVLCQLALGRTSDAEATMGELLDLYPSYELDADSSPRVRAVFSGVRQRLLPGIVRQRYTTARRAYDAKQFRDAATGFAVVAELGGAVAQDDPTNLALRDMVDVAAGLRTLALAALDAEAAAVAAALAAAAIPPPLPSQPVLTPVAVAAPVSGPPTAPPPATSRPASPQSTASSILPSDGIYVLGNPGVTPPVVISQLVSAWRRGVPAPHDGTLLGTIEVVIDETGAVASAQVVSSVSAFYDAILLESAKTWRYRPAMKDGHPVPYRRAMAVLAGR